MVVAELEYNLERYIHEGIDTSLNTVDIYTPPEDANTIGKLWLMFVHNHFLKDVTYNPLAIFMVVLGEIH